MSQVNLTAITRIVDQMMSSRGAQVLFFEGPSVTNESVIIEPVVDGEKIPTY